MSFVREMVGEPVAYRGRTLCARLVGPDLSAHVDDVELAGFYLNRSAAIAAGERYVDDQERTIEGRQ